MSSKKSGTYDKSKDTIALDPETEELDECEFRLGFYLEEAREELEKSGKPTDSLKERVVELEEIDRQLGEIHKGNLDLQVKRKRIRRIAVKLQAPEELRRGASTSAASPLTDSLYRSNEADEYFYTKYLIDLEIQLRAAARKKKDCVYADEAKRTGELEEVSRRLQFIKGYFSGEHDGWPPLESDQHRSPEKIVDQPQSFILENQEHPRKSSVEGEPSAPSVLATKLVKFQALKNLQWSEVTISLHKNNLMSVAARGEFAYCNQSDFNLLNKQTGKDRRELKMLIDLAHHEVVRLKSGIPDALKRLRKTLKDGFGIKNDPFQKEKRSWTANFTVKDLINAGDDRAKERAWHSSYDDNIRRDTPDYDDEDDEAGKFLRDRR